MKDLAIIMLNYNGAEDTIECISSLDHSVTKYSYDIFVLDNGSELDDYDSLKDKILKRSDFEVLKLEDFVKKEFYSNSLIRSDYNYGFAGGNNKIIEKVYSEYKYVLLLNNDTVVVPSFIEEMLDLLNTDKKTKFASCRIDNYYDHSILWNCGGELKPWGLRRYYSDDELSKMPEVIEAEFITGCALFIDSEIIKKYGALTYDFFHGEEDFNFCWRMKKNDIVGKCLNKTLVYHKVSLTSQKSGVVPGKAAGYYVNRIVDMKRFYPVIIWQIWKEGIIFVLRIKWSKQGFSTGEVKKMIRMLRLASKNDVVTKEDTLKVWNMSYE